MLRFQQMWDVHPPASHSRVNIYYLTAGLGPMFVPKVDFGYSTSRKLVVEDVVSSGQKMAEEALFPVK